MKKLRTAIMSLALVFGLGLAPVMAPATAYASAKDQLCQGATGDKNCVAKGEKNDLMGIFKTVVNILLFIVGAVSVIMIVVGGLRYVVSGGDSSAVNSAKNTVMYAIVGIVVAFMAYAIVNFVVTAF